MSGLEEGWEGLAARHYENFPVGSLVLGRAARRHLHPVYAFARTADDLADEHPGGAEGHAALAAMARALERALEGGASGGLMGALARTVREVGLEPELLHDLISAFQQDTWKARYATRAELLDYCRRSAEPVGRIVLRVHGVRDEACDRLSDQVCSGLQIANFLQDVRSDFERRGRIYIPLEDRPGWGEEVLREGRATGAFRETMAGQAEWVRGLFAAGWELARRVEGRLRIEVRAILRCGAAVLELLRERGYDPLARPETLRLRGWRRARAWAAAVLLARPPAALGRHHG